MTSCLARRIGDEDYEDPRRGYKWETALASRVSGYIRFLDVRRLVALAKSYRVRVDDCAGAPGEDELKPIRARAAALEDIAAVPQA